MQTMASVHIQQKGVRWVSRGLTVGGLALLAACTAPNSALRQAQQTYEEARQDATVASQSPLLLQEAEHALRQAEEAKEEEEINHLAYIAQRRVEVAHAESQRKTAEMVAEKQLEERDEIVLEARTRETQAALANAAEAEAVAAALAQELAALQAKQTERGLVLTLGDVLFDYNRASLKSGAQQNLYRLVTFLKEHPEQNVLIEGHTDSKGSESYNRELAADRAQAVRDLLIGNEIGAERITASGYGESYPLATNDTVAGRQQNRRVEIVLPSSEREIAPSSEPGIAPPGKRGY
ncbi:MAG: OmpA family protein [Gammaproteobacteria bacterium]